jgi:hypothetical protein
MAARILIFENAPNLIVPLPYLIGRKGYDLKAVDDGHQAREVLLTFSPDALIAPHPSDPRRPTAAVPVESAPQAGHRSAPGEA